MDRRTLPAVAVGDARGGATGGLQGLRLRLGALTRDRSRLLALSTVAALTLAAGTAMVRQALARWSNFETNAFDFAFFDQIVFSYLDGRPGQTSFIPYNFHGQHIEPILLLFALPYALGAGPLVLTITQAVVAAAAAVPLYFAARAHGLATWLAATVGAAYLANPYLHRAVEFDFHPEVMVAFPAFCAACAIARGRYTLAGWLALTPLLFKEDAAFVSLALAALLWVRGAKPQAKRTALAASAWAIVSVAVVMPIFRHGESSDLVERYGHLVGAETQWQLIPGLLREPWAIPQQLLAPAQLWTALLFLAVAAPLSILRPRYLLLLLPGFAIALLSSHPAQRSLDLHYSANVLPVAIIAGLPGLAAIGRRVPPAAAPALLAGIAGAAFLVASPLAPGHDRGEPPSQAHRAAVLEALRLVPRDDAVRVSAQSGLVARLSRRDHVYEFPGNALTVEYVVVDRYGHRSTQSLAAGFDAKLGLVREQFDLIYASDGVEVFRRRP